MKFKFYLISSFLLITVLGISAFKYQDDFELLLQKISHYAEDQLSEKVYLQFDKPYYTVGDHIWFKSYITTTKGNLSDRSKILYVDLINEQDSIVKSLKLPITIGLAWGDFLLDDKLQEGNYRIRAYTQWMRNFEEAFFYDKTIKIGKSWSNDVFTEAKFMIDSSVSPHKITAQIKFSNQNKEAIVASKVAFQISNAGKLLQKGTAKTDHQGNIQFEIKNKDNLFKNNAQGMINLVLSNASDQMNSSKSIPIKIAIENNFQFFPEGGNLISGLQSLLAFKSVDGMGLGMGVTGKVYDENKIEIASFKDQHLGMGSFYFTPESNKKYTATLFFANGQTQTVPLPVANPSGFVMSIHANVREKGLALTIASSPDLVGKVVKVVASRNGFPCYASKSIMTEFGVLTKIPYTKFPSGIITFTLLGEANLPLAERIVFIRNDTSFLNIEAENLKEAYLTKQKMELDFSIKDLQQKAQMASLSVAITNANVVKPDEANESHIYSYLLLQSDLKGFIQNPNYYFQDTTGNRIRALDQLLLTQGWRNFDWKRLNTNGNTTKKFPAEKEISLQGQVLKAKKPVPLGRVTVLSKTNGLFIADTVTDQQGNFSFAPLVFQDTARFIVQARTEKNKKYVDIVLQKIAEALPSKNPNFAAMVTNVNATLETYNKYAKAYFDQLSRKGLLQKTIELKGVTVQGKVKSKVSTYNLAGRADYTIPEKDLQNCFNLLQCLQGRVPGLMVKNNDLYLLRNGQTPMQIILDGMYVTSDYLSMIVPQNIQSVEALTNVGTTAVYGSRGAGGVLIITTKTGGGIAYDRPAPGMASQLLKGYTLVRNFYQPNYDEAKGKNEIGDFRTTIFWNPNLISNAAGTFKIDYFNAAIPGTYRMIIEGMTIDGKLARKVFNYEVK